MEHDAFKIPPHAIRYSVSLMRERRSGAFLIQRRAMRNGIVYPGRLGLFGGRREGDEGPEDCVIREVAEETGIILRPTELTLLARLLAFDEFGNLSFGHIYLADALNNEQIKTAFRHRCDEGEVLLLRRRDIAARWRQLTSITSYAFGAYYDLEAARRATEGGLLAQLAAAYRGFERTVI